MLFLSSLKVHNRVVVALMCREMVTRFGSSSGGYIWAILEPVGSIAILALCFSSFVRHPPLGTSFVMFFATGSIAYSAYLQTASLLGQAIRANSTLLNYAAVNIYDTIIARLYLQFLTISATAIIIFSTIYLFNFEKFNVDLIIIVQSLFLAFGLAFAVGTTNAILFIKYPVWTRIYIMITRPLFLISGVLFIPEDMPLVVQKLLAWNPLTHIISHFRQGFYPDYKAELLNLPYVYSIVLTGTFASLFFLDQTGRKILEKK